MRDGWITVVAAAMQRADGRWLMHRRPPHKHHGNLWEFPGGKVELPEMPAQSLVRELSEELGITVDPRACRPVAFAETDGADDGQAIVILLYSIDHWTGVPEALEGGAIDWFTPSEAMALPKPPLDVELARRLFEKG